MTTVHKLKVDRDLWKAVKSGGKTAEVRLNDRPFKQGDLLYLYPYPWIFEINEDDFVIKQITHILEGGRYGLKDDYCLLSYRDLPVDDGKEKIDAPNKAPENDFSPSTPTFREELIGLLHKHFHDADILTLDPEFLFADYLIDCLNAANALVWNREHWKREKEEADAVIPMSDAEIEDLNEDDDWGSVQDY